MFRFQLVTSGAPITKKPWSIDLITAFLILLKQNGLRKVSLFELERHKKNLYELCLHQSLSQYP